MEDKLQDCSVTAQTLTSVIKDSADRFLSFPSATLAHEMSEFILQHVAKVISGKRENSDIRFGVVKSSEEWEQVKQARIELYSDRENYLKSIINERGYDVFDSHSYIFAIWNKDEVIASLRFTQAPFECESFLEEQKISHFLQGDWRNEYLELSRLVVRRGSKAINLSRSLIIYAGLLTALSTTYTKYLAYSKPSVREKIFRFGIYQDFIPFSIPSRGDHIYELMKGNFRHELQDLIAMYNSDVNEVFTQYISSYLCSFTLKEELKCL